MENYLNILFIRMSGAAIFSGGRQVFEVVGLAYTVERWETKEKL